MKFPNINSIMHKYLITGYTQNEGDCVQSTIEKHVKNSLKFDSIYVPFNKNNKDSVLVLNYCP